MGDVSNDLVQLYAGSDALDIAERGKLVTACEIVEAAIQPPRPVGYWSMEDGNRERYLARWLDAAFMFAHNISGLPAISVPLGMAEGKRPVGIQLVGRHGDGATILQLAAQAEEAQQWIGRRPAICAI